MEMDLPKCESNGHLWVNLCTLYLLQLYEYMLETVGGNLEDYKKARNPVAGKTMQNFVLDTLETKYKKQGTTGSVFKKEQGFFKELMETTFYNLMVWILLKFIYSYLLKCNIIKGINGNMS